MVSEERISQGELDQHPSRAEESFASRLFFSREERRLRADWRVLIQFSLLAVFVMGVQFIIRYFLYPEIPSLSNYRYFVSQLTILMGVTGSVFVVREIVDRRSFRSLGLFLDAKAGRDFGIGMAISFLMVGFIFLLMWALGWLQFQGFVWTFDIRRSFVAFWLVFLALFLVVAWQEELLFRGYWLVNLNEGLNAYWAVGITGLAYAALHFMNPNMPRVSVIYLILMGLFLGFARLFSQRLWLPLGLHFGWKFFQGNIFGFRVGGLRAPGLMVHQVSGPSLWTGGQVGPETGLVILPALMLAAFFVWMYTSIED